MWKDWYSNGYVCYIYIYIVVCCAVKRLIQRHLHFSNTYRECTTAYVVENEHGALENIQRGWFSCRWFKEGDSPASSISAMIHTLFLAYVLYVGSARLCVCVMFSMHLCLPFCLHGKRRLVRLYDESLCARVPYAVYVFSLYWKQIYIWKLKWSVWMSTVWMSIRKRYGHRVYECFQRFTKLYAPLISGHYASAEHINYSLSVPVPKFGTCACYTFTRLCLINVRWDGNASHASAAWRSTPSTPFLYVRVLCAHSGRI